MRPAYPVLPRVFERLELITLFLFRRVTSNPENLAMKRERGHC